MPRAAKSYPLEEVEYGPAYYMRAWGYQVGVYVRSPQTPLVSYMIADCRTREAAHFIARALEMMDPNGDLYYGEATNGNRPKVSVPFEGSSGPSEALGGVE